MAPGALCMHHSEAPVAPRRRCRVCAVASLAALLVLAVAAAVLALTVLRPRATAAATLEALRLASLSFSPGPAGALSLNATLDADLAIRNPSAVAAFAHDAGRAEVYYRGALAADSNLPAGRVGAGGTERVTVRLTVLAGRLAARAPELYGYVVAGRRVVVVTVCDVAVNLRAPGAPTSSCRYRTKL